MIANSKCSTAILNRTKVFHMSTFSTTVSVNGVLSLFILLKQSQIERIIDTAILTEIFKIFSTRHITFQPINHHKPSSLGIGINNSASVNIGQQSNSSLLVNSKPGPSFSARFQIPSSKETISPRGMSSWPFQELI